MYKSYLLQSPFSSYSYIVAWVAINPEQSISDHLHILLTVNKTENSLQIFILVLRFCNPYPKKKICKSDIKQTCKDSHYLPRKKATYISEEKRVKNWKVNIFTVKLLSVAANERVFSAGIHNARWISHIQSTLKLLAPFTISLADIILRRTLFF